MAVLVIGAPELRVGAMFTVILDLKVGVLFMVAIEQAESEGPGYSDPMSEIMSTVLWANKDES